MTASPLDVVLSRLDKPREVAPGRWRAQCPGHDGKSRDTLAITAGDDGRVLMHCFHGCDVATVVGALGLSLADLMPPRPTQPGGGAKAPRQPFISAQAFDVARLEVAVVAVIGADMHARKTIPEADRERLHVAVRRLDDIAGRAYGRR